MINISANYQNIKNLSLIADREKFSFIIIDYIYYVGYVIQYNFLQSKILLSILRKVNTNIFVLSLFNFDEYWYWYLYYKWIYFYWHFQIAVQHLLCSSEFDLADFFIDESVISEWTACGLPTDQYSHENAVIVTESYCCPFIIDPEGQALKWIKNMELKQVLFLLHLCIVLF